MNVLHNIKYGSIPGCLHYINSPSCLEKHNVTLSSAESRKVCHGTSFSLSNRCCHMKFKPEK